MHCQACDCNLTDTESTRKDIHGKFLDLCTPCYYEIRSDLRLSNNFDLEVINIEDEL